MNWNNINPFSLSRRIKRPLILDGAIGSLLQQKGIKSHPLLWMSHLNIDNPELIFQIHKEYIEAGADIITTNTFRTNPSITEHASTQYSSKNLVKEAVKIAYNVKKVSPVFIAGSNAPAEDCYKSTRNLTYKQLQLNHYNHIDLLINNNVHFILNETQSHFDEIKIICEYCFQNNIPYVMSLFIDENLNILSGEHVNEVIKLIIDHDPLSIGINCIRPDLFKRFIDTTNLNFNWGAYLNCGGGNFTDIQINTGISPLEYQHYAKEYLKYYPSYIGACCGSTPEHINKLKELFDEKN